MKVRRAAARWGFQIKTYRQGARFLGVLAVSGIGWDPNRRGDLSLASSRAPCQCDRSGN